MHGNGNGVSQSTHVVREMNDKYSTGCQITIETSQVQIDNCMLPFVTALIQIRRDTAISRTNDDRHHAEPTNQIRNDYHDGTREGTRYVHEEFGTLSDLVCSLEISDK